MSCYSSGCAGQVQTARLLLPMMRALLLTCVPACACGRAHGHGGRLQHSGRASPHRSLCPPSCSASTAMARAVPTVAATLLGEGHWVQPRVEHLALHRVACQAQPRVVCLVDTKCYDDTHPEHQLVRATGQQSRLKRMLAQQCL